MAQFQIWLEDWEHQCCGDQRSVGQEIELNVCRSHDRLYEQRHDYTADGSGGPMAVPMRGRLVSLVWHRAVLDRTGVFAARVVGYGPGVACESTDNQPPTSSWAFELTVETEDDPPAGPSTPESVPGQADAVVASSLIGTHSTTRNRRSFRQGGLVMWSTKTTVSSLRKARSFPVLLKQSGGGGVDQVGSMSGSRRMEPCGLGTDLHRKLMASRWGSTRSEMAGLIPRALVIQREPEVPVVARDTAATKRRQLIVEGLRVRERRTAAGISVDNLAVRMGADPSWIEEIESGANRPEPSFSTWVDLVWATTEPWPQARAAADRLWEGSESAGSSWIAFAPSGGLVRQAETLVVRHMSGPGE